MVDSYQYCPTCHHSFDHCPYCSRPFEKCPFCKGEPSRFTCTPLLDHSRSEHTRLLECGHPYHYECYFEWKMTYPAEMSDCGFGACRNTELFYRNRDVGTYCTYCNLEIVDNEYYGSAVILKCGYQYHVGCWDKWRAANPSPITSISQYYEDQRAAALAAFGYSESTSRYGAAAGALPPTAEVPLTEFERRMAQVPTESPVISRSKAKSAEEQPVLPKLKTRTTSEETYSYLLALLPDKSPPARPTPALSIRDLLKRKTSPNPTSAAPQSSARRLEQQAEPEPRQSNPIKDYYDEVSRQKNPNNWRHQVAVGQMNYPQVHQLETRTSRPAKPSLLRVLYNAIGQMNYPVYTQVHQFETRTSRPASQTPLRAQARQFIPADLSHRFNSPYRVPGEPRDTTY